MSEASKAVFLSYASQDTEAAKRICDALRAAGVEVWFDQSELVGGDQWDAKIRGQIGSCALFMPVVSASTQARREGYFRIEWRLAAQRTHGMADGTAFLMPVVIDATRDADALVPVEFKGVQWTKLPAGETTAAFVGRVKKLLGGDVAGVADPGPAATRPAAARHPLGGWKWWMVFPIFGMTMALFLVLKEKTHDATPPPAAPAAPANPVAPAVSEARQLAAKARAMSLEKYNSSADDYAAAEGLIKRALELDPNDGEIWAVSSQFNTAIRTRGFDHDPARREAARSQAERALSLAPDSIEGRYALARWQRDNDPDPAVAERTFKEVLARAPDHGGALGSLGTLYQRTGRYQESIALFERMAAQPEWKPLARYTEFLAHFSRSKFPEAEQCIRESVALAPSANSVAGLAMLLMTARGDAVGAVAALAAVPAAYRNEHRVVWVTAFAQLAAHQPDDALRTLDRMSADYIQDNWFTGPKAYWVGRAHAQAGRPEAARLAFESGLELVTARLKGQPGSYTLHLGHAELLAWLGRTDEALAEMRVLTELRQPNNDLWITSRALVFAVLGRADEALPLLRELVLNRADKDWGWPLTPALLRIDPLWDKIRGDARFQKLLAEAEAADLAALPPRDWPKDPELKRAKKLIDSSEAIVSDVALAEDMVKAVLAARPTDTEATVMMGAVQVYYLLRGFDRGEERFASAKFYAERGLALAPDDPEALAVMATYLYRRGVELPRAAKLFRQAIALCPQEPRYYRMLDNVLSIAPNVSDAEIIASAKVTAELFPTDVLVQYELARHYRDAGMLEEAEHYFDIAIKLGPVANAIIARARLMLFVHGDPAGMKTILDQLPERYRGTDRAVFSQFSYAMVTGQPQLGLDALQAMPEPWMIDFDYTGPTALLAGELLLLEGKAELARLQFSTALAELGRHKPDLSRNFSTTWLETWLLMRLGRVDEARKRGDVFFPELVRPFRLNLGTNWWFNPITQNLLLGEHARALELMREAAGFPQGRVILRNAFRLDPRMAPFRDDPEIKALLAEPEAGK